MVRHGRRCLTGSTRGRASAGRPDTALRASGNPDRSLRRPRCAVPERKHAIGDALPDVFDGAADANLAIRFALDLEQQCGHRQHGLLRAREVDLERKELVGDVLGRAVARGARPLWRRHEDREHAAGEAAFARTRQIKLALAVAGHEALHRIRAFTQKEAKQHVVVTVEDGYGLFGHLDDRHWRDSREDAFLPHRGAVLAGIFAMRLRRDNELILLEFVALRLAA